MIVKYNFDMLISIIWYNKINSYILFFAALYIFFFLWYMFLYMIFIHYLHSNWLLQICFSSCIAWDVCWKQKFNCLAVFQDGSSSTARHTYNCFAGFVISLLPFLWLGSTFHFHWKLLGPGFVLIHIYCLYIKFLFFVVSWLWSVLFCCPSLVHQVSFVTTSLYFLPYTFLPFT